MQRKVANETRQDGAAASAARLWAPLARFVSWEGNLGERAEARGPAAHFAYEFIRFGVKQAWACLFGALMLALLVATFLFYPKGAALARYDFLVIAAVTIQVLMLVFKLETIEEAKVILIFHVVGTIMEIFKTSVGSWIYPEPSLLRIGGVPFFMDAVVSPMIASFQRSEPGIMVHQSYGNYSDLVAELDSGQIDLAVTPTGSVDLSAAHHFEPILPARNVLACGAGHPLVRKRSLATEDIVNYPWVAPLPGSPLVLDLHNILLTLGLAEVSVRYAGGSLLSVMNYLAGTDALTILPLSVAYAFRGESKISIIPLDIPQPERALGIMTRKKPYSNPAGRKFLGHLRREFAELRHVIEKYERTFRWAHGPFMADRDRAASPW